MLILFFSYESKSNVQHSIEISLIISTNKLQRSAIKLADPTLQPKCRIKKCNYYLMILMVFRTF
jgi:hypothetical protein